MNGPRVFRPLGAETVLIQMLFDRQITTLHNLQDVEYHIKNSDQILENNRKERIANLNRQLESLRENHRSMLDERNKNLKTRMDLLKEEHETLKKIIAESLVTTRNPVIWIRSRWKRYREKSRCNLLDTNFLSELEKPFRAITKKIKNLEGEIQYIDSFFNQIIENQMKPHIAAKLRIDGALEELAGWLAGARGELKTLKELMKLPSGFVIVNDVYLQFTEPLHTEEGIRFSCQMDHVVVGPPGLFNIESKNWSHLSIEKLDLRSPIGQIRASGKGLYFEANRAVRIRRIKLKKHHWGTREINVRNILAMSGAMPKIDFQYVKMLPIKQVPSYIQSMEPKLSTLEVEAVSRWILKRIDNSSN
ncbi:MAG: NERD domain-containing protein [Candidatus Thorarchaeota archaeon]